MPGAFADVVLILVTVACSLATMIALVLVAIADIDRPFQGSVHVNDSAFTRAQLNMQGEP